MSKSTKPRPDYLKVLQDPKQPPQLALPGVVAAPDPLPEQPAGLNEKEQAIWAEIWAEIPESQRPGIPLSLFAKLVDAEVQYREAQAAIKKYGAVIKSPSNYPIQSPYVSIANKQGERILKLQAELGLTPASRARVKTGPGGKSKKGNPFEGLKAIE